MTKVVLCLALLVSLSPLFAEDKFVFDSTPGTLPKDIVPLHYSIEVRPDLRAMKTSGSETIALEVRRATNQVVLNAVGTSIERASLKGASGDEKLLQIQSDAEAQTITIPISNGLSPGHYELSLD